MKITIAEAQAISKMAEYKAVILWRPNGEECAILLYMEDVQ